MAGALEYDPADQIAVAMSTSGTVVDENVMAALDDLSTRLRHRVHWHSMPGEDDQASPRAAVAEPASPP